MIEPTTLLQSYLSALRDLSGAGCVSLLVSTSAAGAPHSVLLHDGDLTPVPELETDKAAERFLRRSRVAGSSEPIAPASEPTAWSSTGADCLLVALPAPGSPPSETATCENEDRRRSAAAERGSPPTAWLGLRFPAGECPEGSSFGFPAKPDTGAGGTAEPGGAASAQWHGLFGLAGHLAVHTSQISSILSDQTSGLPGRREFQSQLENELDRARLNARHLALLFVNPDDFVRINALFGSEAGDRAVREIADRLRHTVRNHDLVSRYGGVTFAAILRGATAESTREVAGRALSELSERAYLDGATDLEFSIGLAIFEPDDDRIKDPLDLVRRADQALSAAKRREGNAVVGWDESSGSEHLESFDRLAGIFTGDIAKDYRNMMLLWNMVNVVARNDSLDNLAHQATGQLFEALKADGIGMFSIASNGDLELLRGLTRQQSAQGSQARLETLGVDSPRLALMRQALEEGQPCEALLPDDHSDGEASVPTRRCYAVPLSTGNDPLGSLYIEWESDSSHLDASDLAFLNGIGLQLAMAWDRVRLVELELNRQEMEKRQLRAEIKELRQAVQQAKLVYCSPEMEELMRTARRVAASDVTVLVTGPSGTGKELVARTIHELSDRRKRPFVIVDCSAIPSTLIESELFGHERGAYTGAGERRRGRLAEAHQGTVLLDEIGELPLEVQSKLLRFVQEKQFTSVGGSGSRTVDVRIVAATNRDLAAEVTAGRFREDLYYRLNVIQLAIPPLKDRQGDVLHLARHFLELYSVQYQRNIRGLSHDAGQRMLDHSWPGNVRELQNRIMQAVLLCDEPILTAQDLRLSTSETQQPATLAPRRDLSFPEARELDSGGIIAAAPDAEAPADTWRPASGVTESGSGVGDVASPEWTSAGGVPAGGGSADKAESLLEDLARELGHQITAATERNAASPSPLGQWLGDELLLAADPAASGVIDRGAAILDMAPTTYRRRLRKARGRQESGSPVRPLGWDRVRETVRRLVALAERAGGLDDLPTRSEQALLAEILARHPGQTRIGSALLGVTPPTFRRRATALKAASNVVAL